MKTLNLLSFVLLPMAMFAQDASADVVKPPQEFSLANWDWLSISYFLLAVLIILVIVRAFNIGSLTEKLSGRKVINWNATNAWIGIVFLVLGGIGVWYEMIYHGKYVLVGDSYSEHGKTIDSMFMWTFGFTFAVFIITEVLLFYFMFRYRYREGEKADYYYHNNKLEIIWSVIPAIVLTFLVLRGFNTWGKITSERDKDSQEIEVYGYQFGWKARYAGDDKKFGTSHFTFISGKNPLGLAVNAHVDSLLSELSADTALLALKIRTAGDSAKAWNAAFAQFNIGSNATAYPARFKELCKMSSEAKSGAYVRQLKRDYNRKKTTMARITEYRKSKDVFNNAANDDKITTEIVLVKGKNYTFNFRARDVIHSAWFPDFRGQMNVVPGMNTWFSFTPNRTTAEARTAKGNKDFDFYLYCNKICGGAHYNMKLKITVVGSMAEYNTWLAGQTTVVAPPAPAEAPAGEENKGKDSTAAKTEVVSMR
jgi:cytochrome c oxidase subunit 2